MSWPGPRRSAELASAVGAHPGAVHRLLRALILLELCAETADGAFKLAPSKALRERKPDEARPRERMEAEYRALAGAAGLCAARIVPTGSELSVIEALPA